MIGLSKVAGINEILRRFYRSLLFRPFIGHVRVDFDGNFFNVFFARVAHRFF
jgi:hypothetical protein